MALRRHAVGRGQNRRLTTLRKLDAGQLRQLLPRLHRHTRGRHFGPQALRAFLRALPAPLRKWKIPTLQALGQLLRSAAPRSGATAASSMGVWQPRSIRYIDEEGTSCVSNVEGFEQRSCNGSRRLTWHDCGLVYRLRVADPSGESSVKGKEYEVVCNSAFKRLSCVASQKDLEVRCEGDGDDSRNGARYVFRKCVVFDVWSGSQGRVKPTWTLIYLHSFSNKGADYVEFPHYFGVGGANIRVVIPSAPQLEQTCFKDWLVWRGEKLKWKRIRFSAWFDYLTDRGGVAENDLDLRSLLEMRSRLHGLIRAEVRRVGGDARRVILGGASQGCCVALDAAMTYPDELGGVIGCVGHILGSTPLDVAKRRMPLYLFHETNDQEMRWRWVENTVQRLVDKGFNVISRREQDPSGCGHWIQDIEGTWIRSALRRIVLGGGQVASSDLK
eukprot:CAMPEP_0117535734 /NCGR_PEP_ID=MMETSP0784-20121206/41087_1 /TAXON_ID=39447 /ORGANISM="" /LENGTH=442 /DNA_ID=CAMNT_0005332269 /DNA_START=9 /DNA_END=1337 /DNA_ORIENTATION=+